MRFIFSSYSSPNALFLITMAASVMSYVEGQLKSPCPKLFKYEASQGQNDRWYGIVTLLSETALSGVWLTIILDGPAVQLETWFGEIKTDNNWEYLIRNPYHKLEANQPFQLRFYIKYNCTRRPPQLISFRLNGQENCPGDDAHIVSPSVEQNNQIVGSMNSSNVQCGTVAIQPKSSFNSNSTIITAEEGEFPWHAAIYLVKNVDFRYICGGTLITANYILTAAHCVTKINTTKVISTNSLIVYFGKYQLNRWDTRNMQDRYVTQIIVHQEFDLSQHRNNIAILRLSEPVEITDFVRPTCLWDENIDLKTVVNKTGTIVGWGFDEFSPVKQTLIKTPMTIVSQVTCILSYPDFYSMYTSHRTFCASFRNGTSVCNGYTGSAMVLPKLNPLTNQTIWKLRGIFSVSVAFSNTGKCNPSHYLVFTDVAKHLGWIKENLD